MGIHYDYKSKRGERAMLKEAKRKAKDLDNPLLPVVETQADYDLLKSGDEFIEDGSKYKKP